MKKTIIILLFGAFFMSACNPYSHIKPLAQMSELNYGYDVQYAQLSPTLRIAYTDAGQGSTLILIHGLGSYMPAWNRNIAELRKHFRVIAIDLPGYGKSSKAPHSGLMSYYADVVVQFAQHLKLQKFSLAGHSMGGQISMVTALNYPALVENLILIDPAGFENFHAGQRLWFKDVMTPNLVRLTKPEAIETNLAVNFYRMPAEAQFMADDRIAMRTASDFENYCYAVAQSVKGMVDEPVIGKLPQIKQPTLILFGANDNLIPNRYLNPGRTADIAEAGHRAIAGSELVLVPHAGHFLMFEKPDEVNREIKRFMSK